MRGDRIIEPRAGVRRPQGNPGSAAAVLAWVALGVGFSPVLLDLARHVQRDVTDAGILLAPVLLLLAARGAKPGPPAPTRAGVLIALGAALELLGIVTRASSVARFGLPVAVLGVAAALGRPPLPVALLALWVVPVPDTLLVQASPHGETLLARVGAAALGLAGLDAQALGPSLQVAGRSLQISESQVGHALLHALTGVAWLAGVRRGAGISGAALRALGAALLAVPLQLLVAIVAAGLLVLAGPLPAERWLSTVSWVLCAGLALAVILRRTAQPRASPASPPGPAG